MPRSNKELLPEPGGGRAPLGLMKAEDLPSPEILEELGIEPEDLDKFYICLRFVIAQADGMSVTDAAHEAGIVRNKYYDPKWADLFAAARRLIIGSAMLETSGVSARVFRKWPEIVAQLIDTALTAQRGHDKTEAAELLFNMFIKDSDEAPDASEAKKYLKEQPNFNPAANQYIIEAGANVTINTSPPTQQASGEVIDVEATSV